MKHFLTLFLSSFLFTAFVACQTTTSKGSGVELLAPEAFVEASQSEPDAVLIDCRTPGEVSRGSLEGALNIDYNSPAFAEEAAKLNKEKPVYIYCQMGGRSAAAAKKLKDLGFEEVYDMKGGYRALKK